MYLQNEYNSFCLFFSLISSMQTSFIEERFSKRFLFNKKNKIIHLITHL